MKRFLFALLSLVPVSLLGQCVIRGVVVDSLTREPLPLATVYVNGTTLGTTTDHDGRFELKVSSFPATVVSSFVGYKTQAIDLTDNPGELTIILSTSLELPEVVVSGKNKTKKEDLEYFKSMFLGDDWWGKNATIRNEKALVIDDSYQSLRYIRRSGSYSKLFAGPVLMDTVKMHKSTFNAYATEPLVIDLPLLGYVLYVDLVRFSVVQVNSIVSCNILGYFYYKPYDKIRKKQANDIENNRKKAYYGSSQHFLRSLAENSLDENGFVLTMPEPISKRKSSVMMYRPVDVDKYISEVGDSLIQIRDLKDYELKIKFYRRSNGAPINFRETEPGILYYTESGMTLLKDTCTFLKEGVVFDNNIRFTGDISKKRVASCLPNDYMPPVDTAVIRVRDTVDYASELMRFADNIHRFNGRFPQEKVYLEFDNTAYFQGENIWFKAFVTHATTLRNAPSGVLYVDFLAPTGQLIMQQKLKIVEGQADGVISLLDKGTRQTRDIRGIVAYPSGFYEIRAYTQNMLDFSPEAIFSRVIPVYTQPKYVGEYNDSHVETNLDNPLIENLRRESKVQKKSLDLEFYPEGGDLVYGLPCRVAFKVIGNYRFEENEELTVPGISDNEFGMHDGMGAFIVTSGNADAVQFKSNGNVYRTFKLPKPVMSGFSMISDMRSDSLLEVNIWRTPDLVGEQAALTVICRGEVIYFEEIKDLENSHLEVDCSGWPAGVCRMTLFNKDGKILSSRSIFHNNARYSGPAVTVNTDSLSNTQFGKEVLELSLTDESGNPLSDRFCLTVRDAADYGNGRTENLQTNLLLSSDLKGYIHDPAWYLERNDAEHREALNLLTLVQGWERYEWQTMAGLDEFEEKHRVEEGLTMNGWILSYLKREPVPDIGVHSALTLAFGDGSKTFESCSYQTDATGYFAFDFSDFYGGGKLTLHLTSRNQNGKNKHENGKRIRFERADKPKPRPFLTQEMNLRPDNLQTTDPETGFTYEGLTADQLRRLGIVLDGVDIEDERGRVRFVDYDTFTSFEAEEDAELEMDQGEYTTDLRGYFLDRDIRFNEYVENDGSEISSSGVRNIRPYFYVHNLKEFKFYSSDEYEKNMLIQTIDMIDVKSIIVYDKPMRPREFRDLITLENDYNKKRNGSNWLNWLENCDVRYYLIDIQIKEDNELSSNWEMDNLGVRTTTVKGFSKSVEFYSPQYPEGPISGDIDPRRTLYWNPNVMTDDSGRARVEFYNNSFTRKFTINAAGITDSGIPYILNQSW